MVVEELSGTVDLGTCVQIVASASQEVNTAMGAILAILAGGFLLVMLFWALDLREKKLMKDYLRRQGLLNKYEDWKKDRRLGDD